MSEPGCPEGQACPDADLHRPGPQRFAVAVGSRWLSAGGVLVRKQCLLTAELALAGLAHGGFEVAMLIPEEIVPPTGEAIRMRTRTMIVLAELDDAVRPEDVKG